ncbi:MarR family transcriptional regulator [Schumannella luteola]|uniref:DNA-binding MarR family transcriptional regulator n=1 Tax=Schumannella luteola TaxID=472059 RepID=A0A852Y926_9MICO|nr:MarR family transcriptional regulator [Schumannella luteola]NYG97804.1 DNA-binding MarR family transcriptional regulator [Schumannella luteola]TPX02933.1 MarR family transcriptional regulator [Schumannella luteola]
MVELTDPGAETDPDELRMIIQRLSRRIRVHRAADGISDAQLGVLFQLEKHGDRTPGQLAEHEGVTPPSINRTINGLEEAGWITRNPDPDDARRVRIRLTDAGVAIITETRRLRAAWFTQRLALLDPQERRLLQEVTPLLRRLSDS